MVGVLETQIGPVPVVSAQLSSADRWGGVKVRLDFGRMDYQVEPGLYALGVPGVRSPILVTANYKLSFDSLRRHLAGRDLWLLVLDTRGVNVWCAAGKGTFGTDELVARLRESGLARLVDHRQVILPQLAGPGVAAHRIPAATGFTVRYGPILAADVPAYLDGGCQATPAMRYRLFPWRERLLLSPLEVLLAVKGSLPLFLLLALLFALGPGDGYLRRALAHGLAGLPVYGAGVLGGAFLTPLFLPWLPGRAFALKGAAAGLLVAAGLLAVLPCRHWLQSGGAVALVAVLSSYWGMKFTGASTYTSLSGVQREMRLAVPLQLAVGVVGLGCWLAAGLLSGG